MSVLDDVAGAKSLFDFRTKPHGFQKHSIIYKATNENVKDSFEFFDWKNTKNTLLSCGSFDQGLHAVLYGVRDISLFDINKLSKYYVDFKIAAIKAFNYDDYLLFIFGLLNDDYEVEKYSYKYIRKLLPYDSLVYWDELYNYNESINIKYPVDPKSLFKKISYRSPFIYGSYIDRNKYLEDERTYKEMKKNLGKTNIVFYNKCITELFEINQSFDKIFLSNILDYIERIYDKDRLDRLKELLLTRIIPMLNINGEMLLYYMYNYDKVLETPSEEMRNRIINEPYIKENSVIHLFNGVYQIKGDTKDGILVYTKKR